MTNFRYSLFNENIISDFEIFFLNSPQNSKKTSLKFLIDNTFSFPKNLNKNNTIFSKDNIFYLDNENNIFKISKKGNIRIRIRSKKNLKNLAYSVVGIPLGYFFLLKGYYVNHSSTVEKNGTAISFLGHSSTGKSSISNFLMEKKFKFIGEDLCIIKRKNIINKNSDWLKLSKEMINISSNNYLSSNLIEEDARKRFICKIKKRFLHKGQSKIKLCYVPVWSDKTKVSKLDLGEAFKFIFANSYRPLNSENLKLKQNTLNQISEFIENVECFKFERKKDLKFFKDSNDFLLQHIEKNIQ